MAKKKKKKKRQQQQQAGQQQAGAAASARRDAPVAAEAAGEEAEDASAEEERELLPGWWYLPPLIEAQMSKREKQTKRVYEAVELLLVVNLCISILSISLESDGLTSSGMDELFASDPSYALTMVIAGLQAYIVWLLRNVYDRYQIGDVGNAFSNLVVILISEVLMSNAIGAAGLGVLMWRSWRRCTAGLGDWAKGTSIGGKLSGLAGAFVLLAAAIFCCYAGFRIG